MNGVIDDANGGTITGPSAVGKYKLVLQIQVKGKDGMEWINKTLIEFEILAAE